ncbi:hypothetical protein [Tissierella sp.]|uniref:hypothetical protein n=1 Tax=Tissierella sp. TaxID=41274 RepID=UPI00307595FF
MRIYLINSRYNRKENAWKFLIFLLEEDIQFIASKERAGTPINQKGVDKMIEDAIYMLRLSGDEIDNSHKVDFLYDMGYFRVDLSNAVSCYMSGEMTLDEALKKAEENIIIRLNE